MNKPHTKETYTNRVEGLWCFEESQSFKFLNNYPGPSFLAVEDTVSWQYSARILIEMIVMFDWLDSPVQERHWTIGEGPAKGCRYD